MGLSAAELRRAKNQSNAAAGPAQSSLDLYQSERADFVIRAKCGEREW
jgi:hypothetical protein